MPNHTTYYNLVKPLDTEAADNTPFNSNMDTIDTNMKRIDDHLNQDVKTTSNVVFNEVTANIVRGATWANDYAEYYKKDDVSELIMPGHVIALRVPGETYGLSLTPSSKVVVGICSGKYGQIMGGCGDEERNQKEYIAVALCGRVPVFCKGKAKPGDLLVSSTEPGVACVHESPRPGTIIGKVLEYKKNYDIDLVLVQVFLG